MNSFEIFCEMKELLVKSGITEGELELSVNIEDRKSAAVLMNLLYSDKQKIIKDYPEFAKIRITLMLKETEYKLVLKPKFGGLVFDSILTAEMKKKVDSPIGDWLWNADDDKCDPIITPPSTDIS